MASRHEFLVKRGRAIVQAAPQAFIDLDVEADGPAGIGSLLSVGAISQWGDEFYEELRPTNRPGVESCRRFCEEHGLPRQRLLNFGTEPHKAMQKLSEWVAHIVARNGKAKAVMSAFPIWYDFAHIDLAMIENGLVNPFGLNGRCLQTLGLSLAPKLDWELASMNALPREIVPRRTFTHHALEDAKFQQEMHFAMVALQAERYQQFMA